MFSCQVAKTTAGLRASAPRGWTYHLSARNHTITASDEGSFS
jgi:23S rRNA C2498 (ribose-2'-O)-methylase RlmM